MKEHLSESTLLTSALEYEQDEDGNIAIYQDGECIVLTPKQQQDLLSLLEVSLDALKFSWSKR